MGRRGVRRYFTSSLCVVALTTAACAGSSADDPSDAVEIGDHWHVAVSLNICGEWKAVLPRAPVGGVVNTFGDGVFHLRPTTPGQEGVVTLGDALGKVRVKLSSTSISNGTTTWRSGDPCSNFPNRSTKVAWSVNEIARRGNLNRYVLHDGDRIAIGLLPEDVPLGRAPAADALLGTGPSVDGAMPTDAYLPRPAGSGRST